MKENKAQYVKRERDIMSHLDHPFFVKLYFTFQDEEKLCILHITMVEQYRFLVIISIRAHLGGHHIYLKTC